VPDSPPSLMSAGSRIVLCLESCKRLYKISFSGRRRSLAAPGMTVLYLVSGGSGESGHCPLSPEPLCHNRNAVIPNGAQRNEESHAHRADKNGNPDWESGMRNLMLTGLIKMAIQIGKAE
jgi:hypothetical protein